MTNYYKITNNENPLKITLQSNVTTPLLLTYYLNNTKLTLNSTITNNTHIWNIPLPNYKIGDIISDFKVSTTNNVKLTELGEGVSILIDGIDSDVANSTEWIHNFPSKNVYTVQAVFKGDKNLKPKFSNILTVDVQQKPVEDDGTGTYRLDCLTSTRTFTYGDKKEIKFKLTKGGIAQAGKTIELADPSGAIYSKDTSDVNGIVTLTNNWLPSDYTVQAKYWDYTEKKEGLVCQSTIKIKVNKAKPTITFVKSTNNTTDKSKAKFQVRGVGNERLTGYTGVLTVNGTNTTVKTNNYGNVNKKVSKGNTYRFKLKINETKLYKSVSLEATETKK